MVGKRVILSLAVCAVWCCACGGGDKPRPASDYEIWGIDVSRHQDVVSWKQVFRHEKPHSVFVKATEGTLIRDPMYRRHRKALEESGVLWGAYHFFGHRTSGKEQARNFIETARLKKGNLIPVLDIERHRFFKDPEKLVREANAFCREIKREYGVYPILYSSSKFYRTYLAEDFPPDRYRIWIADYSNIPEEGWEFWQHTDSHRIRGVRGKVDRNVFAGSYERLQKLVLR